MGQQLTERKLVWVVQVCEPVAVAATERGVEDDGENCRVPFYPSRRLYVVEWSEKG